MASGSLLKQILFAEAKSEKEHLVSLFFLEENLSRATMRVVAGVAFLVIVAGCRGRVAAPLAITWPHAVDASLCSCCKPVVCCR